VKVEGVARATLRFADSVLRRLTAGLRMLPDFLIIGAQKCGTTALYQYLTEHPCIAAAFVKEVQFFHRADNFERGVNWYRAHFPLRTRRWWRQRLGRGPLLTGEATPLMFHPHASRRVHELIPRAKLIVVMRNPVDRAYSHYHHQLIRGRETLSFEEAIQAEPQRLAGEFARMESDESYQSRSYTAYSYLARGLYLEQIQRWERYFPRQQILFVSSEQFFADPRTAFAQTIAFLDLPPHVLKRAKPHNVGRYDKAMSASTRAMLLEYFKPHNRRLFEYLQMDWGWDS